MSRARRQQFLMAWFPQHPLRQRQAALLFAGVQQRQPQLQLDPVDLAVIVISASE